jgi:hypothetical protein
MESWLAYCNRSPIVNSLWFGMPAPAMLPIVLIKSVILALAAGFAANKFGRISLPILIGVVLTYQILGIFAEWAITGSFYAATQDFRLGIREWQFRFFWVTFLLTIYS